MKKEKEMRLFWVNLKLWFLVISILLMIISSGWLFYRAVLYDLFHG